MQPPLEWDGSFLGHFPTSSISYTLKCTNVGISYCRLNLKGAEIFCSIRKFNKDSDMEMLPIIDEIKPLFNLRKIGSHLIKIALTMYIIYNVKVESYNNIMMDIPGSTIDNKILRKDPNEDQEKQRYLDQLNDVLSNNLDSIYDIGPSNNIPPLKHPLQSLPLQSLPLQSSIEKDREETPYELVAKSAAKLKADQYRKSFLLEIRKILTFRDILGMRTHMGHVIIRDSFPLDHKDMPVVESKDFSVLSENQVKEWFSDVSREDILREMIGDKDLFEIRSEIEKVIERFDRKYFYLATIIIRRINRFFSMAKPSSMDCYYTIS